jgi:cell division protein DivIC
MKRILRILLRIIRNKYILTLLILFVWLLFFDRNNLIDRVKYLRAVNEMEKQRLYYIEKIKEDSTRLDQLRTDNDNLEKFAREQYYMHKEDEEVFVIVDEE